MNTSYLAIEGNIGAGKTSLATLLSEKLNSKLILEEFEVNPFLKEFYSQPDKYAFPLELHFLMERVKQLEKINARPDLFNQTVISDYVFDKTRLFASNNLNKREYKLFQDIFLQVAHNIQKPDVILYLHRHILQIKKNIQTRGRTYEQDISNDYLREIEQQYFAYFNSLHNQTVIILEMDGMGDIFKDEVLLNIISIIEKNENQGTVVHVNQ